MSILKSKTLPPADEVIDVCYGFRTSRGAVALTFTEVERAQQWITTQNSDYQRSVTLVKITKTTTYEKV